MTLVKNINGTTASTTTCKCGSWLQHWKNFTTQTVIYCSASACTNTDLVGAHVQKANSTDEKWYIVPLCRAHNNSAEVLDVGATALVPANRSETCDK